MILNGFQTRVSHYDPWPSFVSYSHSQCGWSSMGFQQLGLLAVIINWKSIKQLLVCKLDMFIIATFIIVIVIVTIVVVIVIVIISIYLLLSLLLFYYWWFSCLNIYTYHMIWFFYWLLRLILNVNAVLTFFETKLTSCAEFIASTV